MNFKQIKCYHEAFFLNQNVIAEVQKNADFFELIVMRGQYLKAGQIIFDDPLDMEAVSTPYDLNLANLLESPNADLEWCYMVSRNGYMVDLALLYAYTNEEEYFELWKKLLFSFIEWQEESPHVWRSLDVGLRLNNWMKSFIYISDLEERFTQAELKTIEMAILKQVNYLKNNFPQKNTLSNWGVLAITGILATAQLLPELVEQEIVTWGWQTLNVALELQFYDDGIHWEQSPMYHHEVTMCIWQLWLNSKYLNQIFPSNIQIILQKAIQASYYYCDQKYHLLPLHDSDAVDFTYIYNLYVLSGFLDLPMKENPGIFYIGKNWDKQQCLSLPARFQTGASGFLAYKDPTIFLTLFNGRHGSGHGHASLGSLTLHYQGKEIIKDPGRYTYTEHPLRKQLKEEFSHSSLMIEQTPLTQIASSWTYDSMGEPIFHQSTEDENQVIFSVSWKGKINNKVVVFKRQVVYFKKMLTTLIINTVDSEGTHCLNTRYQMNETIEIEKQKDLVLLKATPFALLTGEQPSLTIQDKVWSPKYNEKSTHQELLLQQRFENQIVTYECFYPLEQVEIEKIACYQNKKTTPCDPLFYFGLKISNKNKKEIYEYYHSTYDTYEGDKLYFSATNRPLYGENRLYITKGE